MKNLGSLLISFFVVVGMFSQIPENSQGIEEYIANVFEQYTSETEEDLNFESFYEELMALYSRPVNLNNTSREELEKMQFLSGQQIENILYYVYKFGALRTIYELQLIEGLDMTDIRFMLPFVSIGPVEETIQPIKFDQVFRYGKNEVLCALSSGIEKKSGYSRTDNDITHYSGNRLYHHLKYRFHYKDRVSMNFTAEKDAGEQIFNRKTIGYDAYSASVQLKDIGCLKNVIIGDYQTGFGQGMVINQAFTRGKTSMSTNVFSTGNGFKCHKSTNEFNFLRGAAVTMHHKRLNLHLFYSNKNIDGDIDGKTFSGFYKTGYHRTQNELQKKNTVQQILYGGNIALSGRSFQLGFSAVTMQLDHDLILKKHPYNLFYFQGNKQLTSGVDYRIRWKKFNFFGETAVSNKALSTIEGLTFSPASGVNIALVYRNYAPEFNAVYAAAFSEGSRVSNERGLYLGVEMAPLKYWKLTAYADSYQFPWISYNVDVPIVGKDFLLQASFSPSRYIDMYWRFKYENKGKNRSGSVLTTADIVQNCKSSLRYQLLFVTGSITFKSILEGNIVRTGNDEVTYGVAGLQELSISCQHVPLSFDVRYLFFDAVNYENRIYTYEKDVLYAFSSPNFSGLGSRYYVNMRYQLSKDISCWVKFSQNIFADDRAAIGSGNEQITGNKKTEIKCLIRWKFSNY